MRDIRRIVAQLMFFAVLACGSSAIAGAYYMDGQVGLGTMWAIVTLFNLFTVYSTARLLYWTAIRDGRQSMIRQGWLN